MRAAVLAALLTLVLALAGCGTGDSGGDPASSADRLRSGALVYWQTVSDPGSDQWEQAEELLKRFPDGERWIDELRRQLRSDANLDWEEDVEPALGSVVDVAVYAEPDGGEPSVVVLTNPDDPDKTVALAERLAAEGDEEVVTRVVDDWVAISDRATAIDAALKTEDGQALADDQAFESAMATLPDDALTRVYADPARAIDAVGSDDPQVTSALRLFGFDELDFAAAWASTKETGAELAAALRGEGADRLLGTGDPYTSALLDEVPADAFAFYSFRGEGVRRQFERLRENPLLNMVIEEYEAEFGIEVADLVELFEGEVAVYLRPATAIPEIALLLDADDAEAARASAENLLRGIAGRAGAEVTEDGDVTTAVLEDVTVSLAALEDAVVLTTSKEGIADLRGSGAKLREADRFKAALEGAGVPDQYTGLAYVDLDEAIELVLSYAGVSGASVPLEVSRNLEPLRSLVSYGTQDGGLSTSLAFVEIE